MAIIKGTCLGLAILGGIALAPRGMPLLPVESYIAYASAIGGDQGVRQERHELKELPQFYADRFGWEEMTEQVAAVYHSLSAEEQAQACIFTGNYGEAGAFEFFGGAYQLPKIISGHGQYYYWGCDGCSGEVIISIGIQGKYLKMAFKEVIEAAVFTCDYCIPYENNLPIYICRQPVAPFAEIFEHFKHFD